MIKMLSEKELINMYGKEYVEAFERGQLASRLERLFKHICLCPEDEIVDFGCGNGMMLPLLASKVKSYTGVDFSQAFIDAAERTKIELSISNAKFVCADMSSSVRKIKRDTTELLLLIYPNIYTMRGG